MNVGGVCGCVECVGEACVWGSGVYVTVLSPYRHCDPHSNSQTTRV